MSTEEKCVCVMLWVLSGAEVAVSAFSDCKAPSTTTVETTSSVW